MIDSDSCDCAIILSYICDAAQPVGAVWLQHWLHVEDRPLKTTSDLDIWFSRGWTLLCDHKSGVMDTTSSEFATPVTQDVLCKHQTVCTSATQSQLQVRRVDVPAG